MKRKTVKLLFVVILFCLWVTEPEARHIADFSEFGLVQDNKLLLQDTTRQDSVKTDTVYTPSKKPPFNPTYRFGDPFSNRISRTPLELKDPSAVDLEVVYDSSINYNVYERIGEVNFRPVTTMTFSEYDNYNYSQITREYFREKSGGLDEESAVSGRSLLPRLYISPAFDRLFGGSYVDIQPTGFVNLDFGGRWQRVENPSVPIRQQRNGGFNFDQQISLNLVGKIGEKLAVTANFDNNNSFDFQNNLKVEYTGFEEDIIKKIEIGNVSMPVTNSLMTGAQSLFGMKTQLQFGKLFITGVASRQQGQTDVITVENGFQGREFDIRASEYDENRHFFLGHFFRDNYEKWLSTLPQVTSGVIINRIEVYVINRVNDTETTREVLALMDLGEGRRVNASTVGDRKNTMPTNNEANDLYRRISKRSDIRTNTETANTLESAEFGMVNSTDFVRVGTARRLDNDEFTLNEKLGYITLLRKLQNDEMLAVSYEYSYGNNVYKVGELSNDYQQYADDEVIIMKMLRPNKINTKVPTWDLMMKNIYNLNAYQVEKEGFTLRVQYRDDVNNIDNPSLHEGRRTKDRPLIELLGLDQLNQNLDRQKDGNFDYIEGVTIDGRNGNIIFPVLEPFGKTLAGLFDADESQLKEKYVYDTLYGTTKADAQLVASKNKFFIIGKYNAGSSSEIALPGFDIADKSVIVSAGNTPLTEGLDYTVDYNLGRVRINENWLNSGKTITIGFEKADAFNFQSRWLYGARADYVFNDRFNIGATVLHLHERPGGISRFAIGDEPTSNTKYGFDINFEEEVPFLTKAIDFLPLISTKEESKVTFNAEFAQMKPATSNLVDGKATSYIDDFENAVTPISINGWAGWRLASTPKGRGFDMTDNQNPLGNTYRRAKMAWYSVDPSTFYLVNGRFKPDNIKPADLENNYVKPVMPQDIFKQRDRNVIVTPENIFDVAYYPTERGQYNYNTNLNSDGYFNPTEAEKNYGGIMRAITNEVDFDKTNIEYLEFWMLDPFLEGENGKVITPYSSDNVVDGGYLVFNLGSVSEDVVPDRKHAFESGFPADGNPEKMSSSIWGKVSNEPILTNYFENNANARQNQDIGLDGLSDEQEQELFKSLFIDRLKGLSTDALDRIKNDPSADNFSYYLGDQQDRDDYKILERYQNFNGLDGNSPVQNGNDQVRASTVVPDNEDINNDFTLSEVEEYFEYVVPMEKGKFEVGKNFVVDKVNDRADATWYLFRVPIRNPHSRVGNIDNFKTIRYIRMYATGFRQPIVFRFAKMQFVGSQWRKYQEDLHQPGLALLPEQEYQDFNVSVVSIEENSTGGDGKLPYVLPPGIERDRNNTTYANVRYNEQSLQVCVDDLDDNDGRAVFKEVTFDLINYGRIQMFLHAEAYNDKPLENNQVHAFLRLGTQYDHNYYEIEVPLSVTQQGLSGGGDAIRRAIWPLENEIDLAINELLGLKAERNRNNINIDQPYSRRSSNDQYILTIKGNPDLSTILSMMIGVKNPASPDGSPKSICIWANEMRVTDFDTKKGWAANARLSTKLADLATVSASAKYTSIGFGNIQQTVQQRTREETFQYDFSANINVDKFLLPEKTGLKIPMFVSYENEKSIPQFDPLDPDVPLEASIAIMDPEEENRYRRIVEDRTLRRSLNFTNVHKEKVKEDANSHFFDVENLSFSYTFSENVSSNVNTQSYIQKTEGGGIAYNYSPKGLTLEPFKEISWLKSPYLKLIKDVNLSLMPSSMTFRADLNRNFRMTQYYNDKLEVDESIQPYFEKLFTFNRNYSMRWSPFKSLSLDYAARANAVIDELDSIFEGDIDSDPERDLIKEQIKDLGRMKNFNQDITATYRVPFDKFPLTDWISADVKYGVNYLYTAGSQVAEADSALFFGNTIDNKRDQGLSGKIDLLKLYNKVDYLKNINSPKRKSKKQEEEDPSRFNPIHSTLRLLMAVRNINVTYNVRESTVLPGFGRTPYLFGMEKSLFSDGANMAAPGWGFVLGDQNPEIRNTAANNDWMHPNSNLTATFLQTYSTDLNLRTSIEPIKDLKIQLDAKRTMNTSYQEIFRYDSVQYDAGINNGYLSVTPTRKGSYSVSFYTLKTAFDKSNSTSSETFNSFVGNIDQIRLRQDARNPGFGIEHYDSLSQDVLVPAFIAAYSGQSAADVSLSPFPEIPLPGWRIDYNGLSKLPALSELFSAVTFSHGYRSIYNVNDYSFNIENYSDQIGDELGITLDHNILDYPIATDTSSGGRWAPVYNFNQVTISEQFAPLIGLNIKTKSNLSARVEYKKERNLSLNLANASIAESLNNDVTVDFSYSKDEFKLPFKVKGRVVTLDNAVTTRISLTNRNSITYQRKIEGEDKVVNGNKVFNLRPSFTYKINKSLDLTAYFERNINEPQNSSSFRTATTAFGFQLRFGLAQ